MPLRQIIACVLYRVMQAFDEPRSPMVVCKTYSYQNIKHRFNTMYQKQIIVLGGINMDLVALSPRFPAPGETVVGSQFLTYPGGKGANQAVAAARAGGNTLMVGRVGNDEFGPKLLEALNRSGVNTDNIEVSDVSSGIALILIDDSAQNQIIQVLGANETCGSSEEEKISAVLDSSSTLMLQLEVSINLSLDVARKAHQNGVTVILDPSPVRPFPNELLSYCSVITPNETDAEALIGFPVTNREAAEKAAHALVAKGISNAIIKLGEHGAFYANTNESGYIPPFPVKAIDSVGAGDAFNGALAVSLSENNSLSEATRFASAAGALAVTKIGAQDAMPTRSEIENLL